ncbi:cytochrome b561 [Limimonas halophila]|uniref:Cytochrome b561 n=1 Tax=Limimonas halophila TaxID=1082479 RepID=A0A1G7TTL4_9PROT|nr:cytochrome b [Limimonas halophila]SDG38585.1 cytochrome b561 [Limimonas halophila]
MQLRNTAHRYGAVAQALHWVIVVGFVAQFALAWYMEELPNTPFKIELYNLHKSIGVTILVLAVLRLGWRLANPVPGMPAGLPRWEHWAAHASHAGLYAVIFAQPITGLVFSLYSSFPSLIWGWRLPDPGTSKTIEDTFAAAHFYVSWLILALVALHVLAALRHHLVLGNDVLRRMLPGAPLRGDRP